MFEVREAGQFCVGSEIVRGGKLFKSMQHLLKLLFRNVKVTT
jgi:hypothetical protein